MGSGALLTLAYSNIAGRGELFLKEIDSHLLLLLAVVVLPVVLSVLLILIRRSDDWRVVFPTLGWLYRTWTLQLVLVWFWALLLRHNEVASGEDCPAFSNFYLALCVTMMLVSILTGLSMRRGKERWPEIFSVWILYWIVTVSSFLLGVPELSPNGYWWAPDL